MEFTMIYCYQAKTDGSYDEDSDLFARIILGGHHSEETLIEGGHMDEIAKDFEEEMSEGKTVVFEVYILNFEDTTGEEEEELLERLKNELDDLVDTGAVSVIEDYDIVATID